MLTQMGNATRTGHGIRNRLVLSGGLTVVLAVVVAAIVVVVVGQSIATLGQRSQAIHELETSDTKLRDAVFLQETVAFDFALSHDGRALVELDTARASEAAAYAELRGYARNDPQLLAAIDKVASLAKRWQTTWLDSFVEAVKSDAIIDGDAAVTQSEWLFAPVESAIADMSSVATARRAAVTADIDSTAGRLATALVPIGIGTLLILLINSAWLARTVSGPLQRLNRTTEGLLAGTAVTFAPERDDEIGSLANALERMRLDAAERYGAARLEASRAATFNQLAELTSFAHDEDSLVDAAVKTLRRMVPTERGHVMLLNNSTNRLVVVAAWGDGMPAVGEAAHIDRIDLCPGIRRATAYVAVDLADDMTVRCPTHGALEGSVVCLPMSALGSIVGVVHLMRSQPDSFDTESVQRGARVAEQVALAIANARLMKTMEGLAMTDALTGLHNARYFDSFLEQEFASAERDHEDIGLLMLDVDHFKEFNDTYGHPAGDEALRALARTLRSLVRASDVVARYGGEEFIVALHHTTLDEGRVVAEKLRAGVEQTVFEIGPGRYARITVSVGIASTDAHKVDRKGLVSLADAALYRAKEGGRNRVATAPTSESELSTAAGRRSGKTPPTPTAEARSARAERHRLP